MACATDASGRVGSRCRSGMVRLAVYMRRVFSAGSLGCFNPASRAGGVPSLHADGRAEDVALNANDSAQRARGDSLLHWLVANADRLGVQEILWRGYLWSCRNRHLGIRGPGIQQGPHMNHVHVGVGYHTADNFDESWLSGAAPGTPAPSAPPPDQRRRHFMLVNIVADGNSVKKDYWVTAPPNLVFPSDAHVLHAVAHGWVAMNKLQFDRGLAGQDAVGRPVVEPE